MLISRKMEKSEYSLCVPLNHILTFYFRGSKVGTILKGLNLEELKIRIKIELAVENLIRLTDLEERGICVRKWRQAKFYK